MNGRSLWRHIREVLTTAVVEATENPVTIATAYADSVYLGTVDTKHVYGVTDAARAYYGKDASQLHLAECVALAASIKSPGIYSPHAQSERAVIRRVVVLNRLRELGLVSQEDFASAERKLRSTAG